MGRKTRVSDEDLIRDVEVYLKECETKEEIPQVIRFAKRHGYSKQRLYARAAENDELQDSLKKIVEEKELVLEEGGLTGKFSSTMAIFSLKQIGWRDHKEVEISTDEDENTTGVVMIAPIRGSDS